MMSLTAAVLLRGYQASVSHCLVVAALVTNSGPQSLAFNKQQTRTVFYPPGASGLQIALNKAHKADLLGTLLNKGGLANFTLFGLVAVETWSIR